MSLNIKNSETERLVRELASRTGESVTQAVSRSVQERLTRLGAEAEEVAAARLVRMKEIAHDASGRWPAKTRSTDYDAELYDERGLPR
jgi:antitoxin VapB